MLIPPLDSTLPLCYNVREVRKVILLKRSDTMKSTRRDDRHYMSSVRVGPKGQIVIPKEARELFGIRPGDTLLIKGGRRMYLNTSIRKLFCLDYPID